MLPPRPHRACAYRSKSCAAPTASSSRSALRRAREARRVLPYVAARDVAAGRGTRHKMTFTNVVGDILVLGAWTGAPMSQTVPADALKDYDGVAVLLQQGSVAKPGAILGAASASLR
jgi:hypothetical protein